MQGFDLAAPRIEHARFAAVRVDLTDAAATQAAARAAGDVAAFVHAAGVLRVAPLGELRGEDAALMWRLHVEAASRIANVVIPQMVAQRNGRVVLVGSRVAQARPGAANTRPARRR